MAVKKDLYNVAIAGQGYILAGTPDNPARRLEQAPVYGNRFASGDRDYTDFSLWWYWAQTDWSVGIKQDYSSWEDDARYYYSYNIDAFSEYGAIKLMPGLALENDFTENIITGYWGTVGVPSSYHLFVGTWGTSPAKIYMKSGSTWADVTSSGGFLDSNTYVVSQLLSHKWSVWAVARSSSKTASTTTAVLSSDNGNLWNNQTAAIATELGWSNISYGCALAEDGNSLYVAVENASGSQMGIVKTDDNGTSWTVLVNKTTEEVIIDMKIVGGQLYYLTNLAASYFLYVYDISSATGTHIWTFRGTDELDTEWAGGSFLSLWNYKLQIRIPRKDIWEYDLASGTIARIFSRNDDLNTFLGGYFYDFRFPGNVVAENKVWFTNLIYDGAVFYNSLKNYNNSTYIVSPLMADLSSSVIYFRDNNDKSKLYKTNGYKTSGELIFNRIDVVSTIDKLWNSLTFVFDKLSANEKITFYYSADEMATWTEIGGVDYSVDGGSVTSKTILFPENTVAKRIWLKVKLEGGGSSTPVLRDVSIQYLPMPDYKQRWVLQVYCYDDIMLLDGKTREAKRGEELRNILKTAWWSKQAVDFHDIDYAETTLDGDLDATSTTINVVSTAGFPERGRIRIDDEEILYTGKTATAFTGCTRGARGTVATSHSDGATVSNGYKVLITNYSEEAPVGANAKIEEAIVTLELREV